MSLLVVFGKPGAGKSFVADILEKHFGYVSFNGDDALPPDMKKKLFEKGEITDAMRQQFLDNMVAKIKKLTEKYPDVVIHQTFLREYMRKKIIDEFPQAQFLLVECDDAVREKRYLKRTYFNLGLEYLRTMTGLFEAPRIPHRTIYNNKEGTIEIISRIKEFLKTS